MKNERITIFAGHYGSGKTNIAVNYALKLKNENEKRKVVIADLDIVNPYFRTKDSLELLTQNGIPVIASEYANTNLDAPAMPQAALSLFDDKNQYGVIDLGGDDRGAVAIGRYKKYIENEESKNILLVINCYRPLSKNVDDMLIIKNEIEAAASFKFNGIVNNSNLGSYTRSEDVVNSIKIVTELSKISGLPVVMTCVEQKLFPQLNDTISDLFNLHLSIPEMLKNT